MKVKQDPISFQPVMITLESEDELNFLCAMLVLDETVPKAAYSVEAHQTECAAFMNKLYDLILRR